MAGASGIAGLETHTICFQERMSNAALCLRSLKKTMAVACPTAHTSKLLSLASQPVTGIWHCMPSLELQFAHLQGPFLTAVIGYQNIGLHGQDAAAWNILH